MYKLLIIFFLFVHCLLINVQAETDPTKPFNTSTTLGTSSNSEPNQGELRLDSIIHGDGVHTVMISGTLLKVGDVIGEYELIAVNDKSVMLRSPDESKQLYIFPQLTIK